MGHISPSHTKYDTLKQRRLERERRSFCEYTCHLLVIVTYLIHCPVTHHAYINYFILGIHCYFLLLYSSIILIHSVPSVTLTPSVSCLHYFNWIVLKGCKVKKHFCIESVKYQMSRTERVNKSDFQQCVRKHLDSVVPWIYGPHQSNKHSLLPYLI